MTEPKLRCTRTHHSRPVRRGSDQITHDRPRHTATRNDTADFGKRSRARFEEGRISERRTFFLPPAWGAGSFWPQSLCKPRTAMRFAYAWLARALRERALNPLPPNAADHETDGRDDTFRCFPMGWAGDNHGLSAAGKDMGRSIPLQGP